VLDAEIKKQADAMKYQAERLAEAELIKRQREADAKKYEAEAELIKLQYEAEAEKYQTIKIAEGARAEADARRYSMEQEAEGIKAKGLAEAEAIEKKAEAQRKMGEASILEMYLTTLPEIVKNAASPLAQTDKIVMYGDGNGTKIVKDVMNSTNQIIEGVKESTGIDLASLIAGFVTGKAAEKSDK
jgi:flotillin